LRGEADDLVDRGLIFAVALDFLKQRIHARSRP
jgi:hypothetical protein